MALATTTLASAVAVNDNAIVVASATSMVAGRLVRVDGEVMEVAKHDVSGVTIPVSRGRDGTATQAHVITANVTHGSAADFAVPSPQTTTTYPIVRGRITVSVTATSTLDAIPAGVDAVVMINGTAAVTLTIPAPTKDKDGDLLFLVSNGVAAHVPTFTGGLGGVGAGYTALTVATGAPLCILCVACNGAWRTISAPAWTGTVTKMIGGIA
jgi:hypothetical protein